MNFMAIVVENTESKWKEGFKRNVVTRYANSVGEAACFKHL